MVPAQGKPRAMSMPGPGLPPSGRRKLPSVATAAAAATSLARLLNQRPDSAPGQTRPGGGAVRKRRAMSASAQVPPTPVRSAPGRGAPRNRQVRASTRTSKRPALEFLDDGSGARPASAPGGLPNGQLQRQHPPSSAPPSRAQRQCGQAEDELLPARHGSRTLTLGRDDLQCMHSELTFCTAQMWLQCEDCCLLARAGLLRCGHCPIVLCTGCADRRWPGSSAAAERVQRQRSSLSARAMRKSSSMQIESCDDTLWGEDLGVRCHCGLLCRPQAEYCEVCGSELYPPPGSPLSPVSPQRKETRFSVLQATSPRASPRSRLGGKDRLPALESSTCEGRPLLLLPDYCPIGSREPSAVLIVEGSSTPRHLTSPRHTVTPRHRSAPPPPDVFKENVDHHASIGSWVLSRRGIELRLAEGESVSLLGTTKHGWALVRARGQRGWVLGQRLAVGPSIARSRLRGRCDELLALHTDTGRRRAIFQFWLQWSLESEMSRFRRNCLATLLKSTHQGLLRCYFMSWFQWWEIVHAAQERERLFSLLGRGAERLATTILQPDNISEFTESSTHSAVTPQDEAQAPPVRQSWEKFRVCALNATAELQRFGCTAGAGAEVQRPSAQPARLSVHFAASPVIAQGREGRRASADASGWDVLSASDLLAHVDCGIGDEAVTASPLDVRSPQAVGSLHSSLAQVSQLTEPPRPPSIVEWILQLPTRWTALHGLAVDSAEGGFLGEDMLCTTALRHAPRFRVSGGSLPFVGHSWERSVCCVLQGCCHNLNRLLEQGSAALQQGILDATPVSEDGPSQPCAQARFIATLRRMVQGMEPPEAVNGICAVGAFTHRSVPPPTGAGLTAAGRLQIGEEACRAMRYYSVPARMAELPADDAQRLTAVVSLFSPLICGLDSLLRCTAHDVCTGFIWTSLRLGARFPAASCAAFGAPVAAVCSQPANWLLEPLGSLAVVVSNGAAEVSVFAAAAAEPFAISHSDAIYEVAAQLPVALLRILSSEREIVVFRERPADGELLTATELVDVRLRAAQESAAIFSDFASSYLPLAVGQENGIEDDELLRLFDKWLQEPLVPRPAASPRSGASSPPRRNSRKGSQAASSGFFGNRSAKQPLSARGSERMKSITSMRTAQSFRGGPKNADAQKSGFFGKLSPSDRRQSLSERKQSVVAETAPQEVSAWLLLGAPGGGTTSAALAMAQRTAAEHPDWAYVFVSLPAVGRNAVDPGALERYVLHQLNVSLPAEVLELQRRKLLIIVDAVHELELYEEVTGKGAAARQMAATATDPVRALFNADPANWNAATQSLINRCGLGPEVGGMTRWREARVVVTCRSDWLKRHGLTAEHLTGAPGQMAVLRLRPLPPQVSGGLVRARAAELVADARVAAEGEMLKEDSEAEHAAVDAAVGALPECLRRFDKLRDSLRRLTEADAAGCAAEGRAAGCDAVDAAAEAIRGVLPADVLSVPLLLTLGLEGLHELQRAWAALESAAPGDAWKRSMPGAAEVWESWLRAFAGRAADSLPQKLLPVIDESSPKSAKSRPTGPPSCIKVPGKKPSAAKRAARVRFDFGGEMLQTPTHAERSAARTAAIKQRRRQVRDYITLVCIKCFWMRGDGQISAPISEVRAVPGGDMLFGDLMELLPLRRWEPTDTHVSLCYAGLADYCAARAGLLGAAGGLEYARLRQKGWPRASLVHTAAVSWGHPGLCGALMAKGARVDVKDAKYQQPPIVCAAAEQQGGAMWVLYTTAHGRRHQTIVQDKVLEPLEAELKLRLPNAAQTTSEMRLAEALAIVAQEEGTETCRKVDALLGAWMVKGAESIRSRSPLHFAAATGEEHAVLRLAGDQTGGAMQWQILAGTVAGIDAILAGSKQLEQMKDSHILRELISDPRVLGAVSGDGSSALHNACRQGRTRIAEALVHCGADPAAEDRNGVPPLHFALRMQPFREPNGAAALRLLCVPSALAAEDREGFTPLHRCCTEGWVQPAVILIRAGAEPAAQDRSGKTPIHHALKRPEFSTPFALPALALLANSAALRWRGTDGSTVLHHACRAGRPTVACALVDCGGAALTAAVDDEGRRPLHDAVASGQFADEEGERALLLLAGSLADLFNAFVDEGMAVALEGPANDQRRESIEALYSSEGLQTVRWVFRCLACGIRSDAPPVRVEDVPALPLPPGGWEIAPMNNISRKALAAHSWGTEDGVVLDDGGLYSTNASRYAQPGGRYASKMLVTDSRGRHKAKTGHIFLRAAMPEAVKHGSKARVRVDGFGAAVPAPVVGAACRRFLEPYGWIVAVAVRAGGRAVVSYSNPDQATAALEVVGGRLGFESWQLTITPDGMPTHAMPRLSNVPSPRNRSPRASRVPGADEGELVPPAQSQRSMSVVSMLDDSAQSMATGGHRSRQMANVRRKEGFEDVMLTRVGSEGLGLLFDQDSPSLILRDIEERSSAEDAGLWRLIGWRLTRVNGVNVQNIDDARSAATAASRISLRFEAVTSQPKKEKRPDSGGKTRSKPTFDSGSAVFNMQVT
eukprot:TRINITY_DN2345_c1_g2_i1.p1 TRINITY_DN2345_c1_g2~~TRINITY_DN2345_c1_g2_i1.p1  ORF type:complete len:2540 (+),score=642.24 TRINITY_DN2345_c1_g2_i1:82-7620(+)